MRNPTFDIFLGESEKDAIWLENIAGLSAAEQRMQKFAAKNPGLYFVWCADTESVVARANTFRQPELLTGIPGATSPLSHEK